MRPLLSSPAPGRSTIHLLSVALGGLLGAAVVTGCTENTSPPLPVTVTSVSPTTGPLAGWTAVTITGTNFPTTVDSVRVGTGRLGSLVRVSATQLTGTTPGASAAGMADVVVYTASAGSGTCTACFTYNAAVALTWLSLTAGSNNTCGLTATGAAYCWGDNQFGGLGTSATMGRCAMPASGDSVPCSPTPVAVTGGLTFASLTGGSYQNCGLTSSGAAYCWGRSAWGSFGNGDTLGYSMPVTAGGGLAFASLSAGGGHSCGLSRAGAAYCWGDNQIGELGDGSTIQRWTPVAVAGGITFASLTAGQLNSCGVTSAGAAYCWGDNGHGQLGRGDTLNSATTPVAVTGGLTFVSLGVGGWSVCGLTRSGAAYCWGNNAHGELGDGSTTNRTTPVAVAGGLTFVSLGSDYYGSNHTCGLTSSGAAYCWGRNDYGQLGDGSTTNRTAPVAVVGGLTFASLAVGGEITCGVTSAGAAYCWGIGLFGKLGTTATLGQCSTGASMEPCSPVPVAVAGDLTSPSLRAAVQRTTGPTMRDRDTAESRRR